MLPRHTWLHHLPALAICRPYPSSMLACHPLQALSNILWGLGEMCQHTTPAELNLDAEAPHLLRALANAIRQRAGSLDFKGMSSILRGSSKMRLALRQPAMIEALVAAALQR